MQLFALRREDRDLLLPLVTRDSNLGVEFKPNTLKRERGGERDKKRGGDRDRKIRREQTGEAAELIKFLRTGYILLDHGINSASISVGIYVEEEGDTLSLLFASTGGERTVCFLLKKRGDEGTEAVVGIHGISNSTPIQTGDPRMTPDE
eukprot:1393413-Amorphochlora_amoeboformis.AAC.1